MEEKKSYKIYKIIMLMVLVSFITFLLTTIGMQQYFKGDTKNTQDTITSELKTLEE